MKRLILSADQFLRAGSWRAVVLTLYKSRKIRRHSQESRDYHEQMRSAARHLRDAFDAQDWLGWDRWLAEFNAALARAGWAHAAPLAVTGKAVREGGSTGNARRRDRALQKCDKETARARARKLWAATPMLPVPAVVRELKGLGYTDQTIAGWIRDLCPTTPRRGRPRHRK